MTRRGLVLGNSHTACLREAWRVAEETSFTLDFLAAHKELLSGLEFANGRAEAGTEELRETLEGLGMRTGFGLDEYDFYVVTACQVSMFRAIAATRQMAVWPNHDGPQTLVSNPAFVAALTDDLRSTTARQIVDGLSDAGASILILPQPRPNESVLHPETRFPGFRNAVRSGHAAWVSDQFEAACEAAMDGKAAVLHQPAETVAEHVCTADRYQSGSIRLASGHHQHDADDILHANADYGALQLTQIRTALD